MDLRTQEILILAVSALAVLAIFLLYRNRDRLQAWIDALSRFFGVEPAPDADANWRLFWISFAGVYVEIMLIRWLGTEVRAFAYFQNLALIACFLGFGLGCYWAERRKGLVFSLLAIVGLVTLVKLPSHTWQVFLTVLSTRLSFSSDAAIWSYSYEAGLGTTYWVVLLLAAVLAVTAFLLLLVAIMIPLGQWVGFYLDHARNPIKAYSANLVGSVLGIWTFAGMAFLHLGRGVRGGQLWDDSDQREARAGVSG